MEKRLIKVISFELIIFCENKGRFLPLRRCISLRSGLSALAPFFRKRTMKNYSTIILLSLFTATKPRKTAIYAEMERALAITRQPDMGIF